MPDASFKLRGSFKMGKDASFALPPDPRLDAMAAQLTSLQETCERLVVGLAAISEAKARPTDTATEDAPRALRTHSEVVPPPTVTSPVVTFANATAAPNLQPDNGQGAYIA
uniref:Uncharacterized protein n=1 Tax=Haptolina brevifila TaxID=156173 RepID=A0A7S2IAF5_9EUKA|mmetsp:Transcript_6355/g.13183  ORF Transcript_6355/g.13183 Transcript_6355/m.13183 type:complete len:111 (+) Transcript_6355:416-748(+)